MYHVSTQGVDERIINVHYYIMHKHISDHLEMEKQEGKMEKVLSVLAYIKNVIPYEDQLLLLCLR